MNMRALKCEVCKTEMGVMDGTNPHTVVYCPECWATHVDNPNRRVGWEKTYLVRVWEKSDLDKSDYMNQEEHFLYSLQQGSGDHRSGPFISEYDFDEIRPLTKREWEAVE